MFFSCFYPSLLAFPVLAFSLISGSSDDHHFHRLRKAFCRQAIKINSAHHRPDLRIPAIPQALMPSRGQFHPIQQRRHFMSGEIENLETFANLSDRSAFTLRPAKRSRGEQDQQRDRPQKSGPQKNTPPIFRFEVGDTHKMLQQRRLMVGM
jgi:hypothetical protein